VKTPYRCFANEHGRVFAVRLLPGGARYGRTNSLIADGLMVEFYDTTGADDGPFGPLGQFVSRYYVATILGTDGYGSGQGGLDLDGGVPVWKIGAAAMGEIRSWLGSCHAGLDRS
jgi:hypothetical protein